MTVMNVPKQAQALSPQERKELIKLLVDSLDVGEETQGAPEEHWGQSLVQLLHELFPIGRATASGAELYAQSIGFSQSPTI